MRFLDWLPWRRMEKRIRDLEFAVHGNKHASAYQYDVNGFWNCPDAFGRLSLRQMVRELMRAAQLEATYSAGTPEELKIISLPKPKRKSA